MRFIIWPINLQFPPWTCGSLTKENKKQCLRTWKYKADILTSNMPLIHTLFTCSKWNMSEICGQTFHLLYVHASIFFWNSSIAQKRSFQLLNLQFWQRFAFLWSKNDPKKLDVIYAWSLRVPCTFWLLVWQLKIGHKPGFAGTGSQNPAF